MKLFNIEAFGASGVLPDLEVRGMSDVYLRATSGADVPPQPKYWLGMTREDEDGWWVISGMEWDAYGGDDGQGAWFYEIMDTDAEHDDLVREDSMTGTWEVK